MAHNDPIWPQYGPNMARICFSVLCFFFCAHVAFFQWLQFQVVCVVGGQRCAAFFLLLCFFVCFMRPFCFFVCFMRPFCFFVCLMHALCFLPAALDPQVVWLEVRCVRASRVKPHDSTSRHPLVASGLPVSTKPCTAPCQSIPTHMCFDDIKKSPSQEKWTSAKLLLNLSAERKFHMLFSFTRFIWVQWHLTSDTSWWLVLCSQVTSEKTEEPAAI